MESVIIDASVALKWFFESEDDHEKATLLLQLVKEGKLQLIIPDIWWYEITNVFRSNIKSRKMKLLNVESYLKDLLKLKPVTINFMTIMDLALKIAVKLDISVYDASYVALSKSQNFQLYTADKKLLEKIPNSFKKIRDIKDLEIVESEVPDILKN